MAKKKGITAVTLTTESAQGMAAASVDAKTGEILPADTVARKLDRLERIREVQGFIGELESKLTDQKEACALTKASIAEQQSLLAKLISSNPEEEFDFDAADDAEDEDDENQD